jgi:hypothetical protein
VQSINSSTNNIHENLQMKINKKRVQQPEDQQASKEVIHHQRVQSNPTYLSGYSNGIRSYQQFMPDESGPQKPLVPPKTGNSQKRGTLIKYNIPLKNDNSKALNNALDTLNSNV